jgi:hypothetical protein
MLHLDITDARLGELQERAAIECYQRERTPRCRFIQIEQAGKERRGFRRSRAAMMAWLKRTVTEESPSRSDKCTPQVLGCDCCSRGVSHGSRKTHGD